MGAYLSQPITKKESTNHEGSNLTCGASSMQGWRIYQEDAHNVIIDFDENKSLFAVYDGHGGSEVAVYTSQHLPEFIKKTEQFKKGNYKQALIDAFMEFDESLIKDEVMAILKTLKKENEGEDSYPATDEDALDDDGDENVSNLYEEATMPLSEVISRYRNPSLQRLKESGEKPMSPRLKSKDKKSLEGAGCSSSSSSAEVAGSSSSAVPGPSPSKMEVESATPSSSSCTSSSSPSSSKHTEKKPATDSSSEATSSSGNTGSSGTTVSSDTTVKSESSISTTTSNTSTATHDTAQSNSSGVSSTKSEENGGSERVENGEVKKNGEESTEISSSDNKVKPVKGKAKDKPLVVTNGDGEIIDGDKSASVTNGESKKQRTSPRKLGTKNLLESTLEDDSRAEGLSREDIQKRMKEALDHKDVPGMDSGCTAVVVLFVDNEVYIANAGDSRAVLCRDSKAQDLSEDHKPEDEAEKSRIVKAGGEVTPCGRVNGGLNLSRALGDHSYKQTAGLPLSEQMISALPDVQTISLTPQDEFIVIACDGIWNSLSSQEVVDFVRERIGKQEKLSDICEELFDKCLAPDSLGDGTGCDNMTCVLVKIEPGRLSRDNAAPISVASAKRSREDTEAAANPSKKSKTEEGEVSSVTDV
ncbi:hypothetical protein M8J75_005695 [Diaphorina citri]|nr:hypothetical protein M8J75_005695 [Diaphorina citri]